MEKAILPPSLMVTSIIGFILSAIYTASGKLEGFFMNYCKDSLDCPFENFGVSLGFAFCLAFVLMFIASVISMTPSDKELSELR